MKERISIVIPVYNGADTLRSTLVSALAQSHRDLEVVVVDDGSEDASAEIVEEWDDPRLRLLRSERGGVSRARNLGAEAATGHYLAFLDADDLWTQDKLAAQLGALLDEGAEVAYSWTAYIDHQGRRIGRGGRPRFRGDVYEHLLRHNFCESASNALFTRRCFEQAGGFDPTFSTAADWDLLLRVARTAPFATPARLGVLYRVGIGGMSSDVGLQEAECVALLERELDRDPQRLRGPVRQGRAWLAHYLSFKALEGSGRQATRTARAYLLRSLRTDPGVALQRLDQTRRLAAQLVRRGISDLWSSRT